MTRIRTVSRRVVLLLLIVLAVPALALAADTDPKKQINPADQRKAASIVLKRADFAAGWRKAPNTPDSGEDPTCPGYNPDQSDLILTGEVVAEFEATGGIPSLSSIANIYKTRRDALAAWTRSARPALASCLARFFKQAVEGEGGKASIVRSGPFAFPKLAPRAVAYRAVLNLVVTEGGQQAKVPVTIHFVALGSGRGDAVLLTIGLGNGIPVADLRAFAKLTATRLAAAKL
jgi:hypothetical protein